MRCTWSTSCAALATMAMVAAGCGDKNNGVTARVGVTRAQYVQSVRARCGEYQKARYAAEQPLAELFKGVKDPRQMAPEKLKAASDKLAALNDTTRQVLIDLSKLPRPEADRAAIDQVFANYDHVRAALDKVDQAAAAGDGAAVSAATNKRDQAVNRNSRQVKDEFGFSACE